MASPRTVSGRRAPRVRPTQHPPSLTEPAPAVGRFGEIYLSGVQTMIKARSSRSRRRRTAESGHFASLEEPDLVLGDLRTSFRPYRRRVLNDAARRER